MNYQPVKVPAEALAQIQALYDHGLYVQAYQAAQPFLPLQYWHEPKARTLAGRLAANLGGYRIARVQHRLAWRVDKTNPELVAYHAYTLLERYGPLAALHLLQRFGNGPGDAPAEERMHLATVWASVLAQLRDFQAAEEWMEKGSSLAPDHPWLWAAKAHILELQDRYAESLEAAQQALKLHPWFRPGIQAFVHCLQLLDRDEQALEFLQEACRHIESMHVQRQMTALLVEFGQYAQASSSLDQFVRLAVLLEKGERRWTERQRVTLDCLSRNWQAALGAAGRIDEPYYKELAARLERGGAHRQVRLEVPFVRQHHLTCAPATLTAISRFWHRQAEHLEVAEAICYDGTPSHSERHWAETHGWVTREFTVSWAAATALIDRGVPFTLTTSGATAGHLQAVIGYDEIRETLWIRDPFVYYSNEFPVKALLESQRPTGPRGMALVPADRAELLSGLELPDAPLYDQLYALDRALAVHQRDEALRLCQAMQASAPDHRLTLQARCAIASYDSNLPAGLESTELLLQQFPDCDALQLTKLRALRDLARRKERLELLAQLCSRSGSAPVFWQQYAQELRCDARQRRVAAGWIRWALRYRPTDPLLVSTWADILWDDRQFALAARLYRIAACLGDRNEQFARSFFIAARHLRQAEQAIQFLQVREARLGRQAAYPTITLVESLQHLRRTKEALAVLAAALKRRPEDGVLHLFAADFHARLSQFNEAQTLLQGAQTRCAAVAWHRTAACLAGYRNRKSQALAHWREVLKVEPLAHDAIEAVALLLAETESRTAALQFLDELCARFPCSCPLLTLRIRWLTDAGSAELVPQLRKLLEVNPADSWAWRELALDLSNAGRAQEALDAAQEAIRLEPNFSPGYSVRGQVLIQSGRLDEGRADYLEALRLEVDNDFALCQYVSTAPTLAQRKQALEIVAEELRRQVIFRDALFAYQAAARGVLPAREVLRLLQDALRARPDLWQAWSVVIRQLVDVGDYDDALRLAKEATGRFPLFAPLWVDLATVEQARLNDSAQIAALQKALEISANHAFASRQLADIYQRQHLLAEAKATLEQAIAANPLDPFNHGCLAHVLWDLGEHNLAIERVRHAVQLEPGYDWAWNALKHWGRERQQPNLAAETARELTRLRGGQARSWLRLAACLDPAHDADELFATIERALELNPRSAEAYDLRACVLARTGRFEEALAQCRPTALLPTPAKLLVRAAWVEAERGNLPKAVALAEAALAEHPDQYWGWQLLSDWQLSSDHVEEAARAAEKMSALAPLDPVPLGYLGDLKLRLEDPQAARAAFERAFQLEPNYQYAGFKLFALQIKARETEAAQRTLTVLRRQGETHETLACAVELELARQNTRAATDLLDTLCSRPDAQASTIARAASAFNSCNQEQAVLSLVQRRLKTRDCSAALAEYWVENNAEHGHWWLHRRLAALPDESRRRAVILYLDFLGRAAQAARQGSDAPAPFLLKLHFWLLLKKHRAWLRQDLEGWGKSGYALTCLGRAKAAAKWLGDWKTRPQAESWMLFNLFIMLQELRRYAESLEVIRHAVTLRHEAGYYQEFRVWGAFEEALAGNLDQAESHLANLPAKVKDSLLPLAALTRLLMELDHRPPATNREARQRVREGLLAAFPCTAPCRCRRSMQQAYHRCVKAVAARHGRLGIWPWWFFHGRLKSG